jgi:putative transposase
MSRYRRATTESGTYFFTVVTYRRQTFLCDDDVRAALRDAIAKVRRDRPFRIDAWVLLPEHFHAIWTLPADDCDYSQRWAQIKRWVTRTCSERLSRHEWINVSKRKHRESTLWQRRFWEHEIRDERDYRNHMDYLHYNPVKHGHVERVVDWRYSSFHRLVREHVYPPDWGAALNLTAVDAGEPL